MSHSQFHCTGRAYLDMHGLIFETSICYWQDQPGRSALKPREDPRLSSVGWGPGRPDTRAPAGGSERVAGTPRPRGRGPRQRRRRRCGRGTEGREARRDPETRPATLPPHARPPARSEAEPRSTRTTDPGRRPRRARGDVEPGEGGRGRASPPPRKGSGPPEGHTHAREGPRARDRGRNPPITHPRPPAGNPHGAERARDGTRRGGNPRRAETRPGRSPAPAPLARVRAHVRGRGGWGAPGRQLPFPPPTPRRHGARPAAKTPSRLEPAGEDRDEERRGPKPPLHPSPPALPGGDGTRRGRGRAPRGGPAGAGHAPGCGNPLARHPAG